MMKKLFYIFSFCFLSVVYYLLFTAICSAQNPDIKRTWNWYFGEYAAMNFSSGSPVALTNSAMLFWGPGPSSISDTSGNLLFYTDGKSVWNRNHQLMPNGTGLISGAGSIHSTIIIPKPQSSNIYYIFHNWADPNYRALRYTTVDMSSQGGMGDVTSKNDTVMFAIPSFGPSQKLAATMHKNNTDVWIMTNRINTNSFYAFRVTAFGVDTTPVVSSSGKIDMDGDETMKFSPSGRKIALGFSAGNGFEILDFDNATGMVSNPIVITPPVPGPQSWGLEFSSDESKLYVNDYTGSPTTVNLYQVDLSSGDSLTIVNSLTFISSLNPNGIGRIQIASDGKLYVGIPSTNPTPPYYIGVIANPNVAGVACNFTNNGVDLGGRRMNSGLPTFISNYFYDSTLVTVTPALDAHNNVICYPNPFKNYCYVLFPQKQCDYLAKVSIYNVLGCEITYGFEISFSCNKEDKPAVMIIRKNISQGIYVLQMTTGGKTYSKKLILLD